MKISIFQHAIVAELTSAGFPRDRSFEFWSLPHIATSYILDCAWRVHLFSSLTIDEGFFIGNHEYVWRVPYVGTCAVAMEWNTTRWIVMVMNNLYDVRSYLSSQWLQRALNKTIVINSIAFQKLLRVSPNLFLCCTLDSWRTLVDKTIRLIKPAKCSVPWWFYWATGYCIAWRTAFVAILVFNF